MAGQGSPELEVLDGRIELRQRTGAGAMGCVHRAWDLELERAVAVKLPGGSVAAAAEQALCEARRQARVEHPHVVRVHRVGTLGGRPCIVAQLVDGPTLGERARALAPADRVELLRQAALGVHALHEQGLVHRDVKPGNILLEEGPGGARRALLADFGLACDAEEAADPGRLPSGTLDYMSPEQLLGYPADPRSDVYALGATLYTLLAGRPPFHAAAGDEEAAARTFRAVVEEEPVPLGLAAPGTPARLRNLVARSMAKDPEARPQGADLLAEELGACLRALRWRGAFRAAAAGAARLLRLRRPRAGALAAAGRAVLAEQRPLAAVRGTGR